MSPYPNLSPHKKVDKDKRISVKFSEKSNLGQFIKNEKEKNPDLTYEEILEKFIPRDMDDFLTELFDSFRDSVLKSLVGDSRSSDAYRQMEALRILFLKYVIKGQGPKNPDKVLNMLEPTQKEEEDQNDSF